MKIKWTRVRPPRSPIAPGVRIGQAASLMGIESAAAQHDREGRVGRLQQHVAEKIAEALRSGALDGRQATLDGLKKGQRLRCFDVGFNGDSIFVSDYKVTAQWKSPSGRGYALVKKIEKGSFETTIPESLLKSCVVLSKR